MKNRRLLFLGLSFLCLAGVVFCGWNFYQEMKPRAQAEQAYNQIRERAFRESAAVMDGDEDITAVNSYTRKRPDFETLSQWNPDIAGWIWLPESDIDYPVVQGIDNDYYLNHTADGERNIIGSIFMESHNQKEFQDDVTILYGHHIRGGRMFSSLSGYKTQSYYEEHPVMYLYTPDKAYRVDLFAGEILDGQIGSFPLMFESAETRERWLKKLLVSSTFKSSVAIERNERILALCTCSYEYNNARYAVYGVLRDMEDEQNEK
jgi:sortase B